MYYLLCLAKHFCSYRKIYLHEATLVNFKESQKAVSEMGNVFEEYAEERLLETAINMLKEDFSIDTILKIIPSVSRDQILALEEQIKMQAAI